jgi:hypothetical protein
MKEKDLKVEFKPQELILYAEKEDETYEAVKTGSIAAKLYLDDYFMKQENLDRELRSELSAGKISPVYYYMLKQDIGLGDLAKRMGIRKRKLRKHFKPDGFAKLDEAMLQKYAVIFGVTVEGMRAVSS